MNEIVSIMDSVARVVAIIGGGLSTVAFAYAGIMWMTASGDPQKMGQAKMAFIGAFAGLILVGVAFIAPKIVSDLIIEPVGGVSLRTDAGVDCDQIFRNMLVFQRGASSDDNMNVVIRQIQAQRDECSSEIWNPLVSNTDPAITPGPTGCINPVPADEDDWVAATVGDTQIPRGLHLQNNPKKAVRLESGRDSDNNIIVYFDGVKRPNDSAVCWLYNSRLTIWDQTY